MKILLSNDDGVFAAGIRCLARELLKDPENEVFVAAPDRERSAVSRSMTLYSPLRAYETRLDGLPQVQAFAIDGTPVDCVRLAIGNLFPEPDLVIAGINHGPNLGTDVLYSGTVAAAHEAGLLGYRAIAISSLGYEPKHLETAGRVAQIMASYAMARPVRFGTLLNVNVPDVPFEALKGVKLAPACVEEYALRYVEREDPMGVKYYWAPRGRISCSDGMDVDDRWAREGYVSLTPLCYDLTDHSLLSQMEAPKLRICAED